MFTYTVIATNWIVEKLYEYFFNTKWRVHQPHAKLISFFLENRPENLVFFGPNR